MKKTKNNIIVLCLTLLLVVCLSVGLAVSINPDGGEGVAFAEVSVWDGTSDTDLATDSDGAYLISSAAELKGFAELVVNGTISNQTVKLTTDISLNNSDNFATFKNGGAYDGVAPAQNWSPIVNFNGVFDGQNHTINYMYCNFTGYGSGFFGNCTAAPKVKNLNFSDCYSTSTENGVGIIAGDITNVSGSVQNCKVIDSAVVGVTDIGVLGGFMGRFTVSDCVVENCKITATAAHGAALIGASYDGMVVNNCTAVGNTIVCADATSVGVFTGDTYNSAVTFNNCASDCVDSFAGSGCASLVTLNNTKVVVDSLSVNGADVTDSLVCSGTAFEYYDLSDNLSVELCFYKASDVSVVVDSNPIDFTFQNNVLSFNVGSGCLVYEVSCISGGKSVKLDLSFGLSEVVPSYEVYVDDVIGTASTAVLEYSNNGVVVSGTGHTYKFAVPSVAEGVSFSAKVNGTPYALTEGFITIGTLGSAKVELITVYNGISFSQIYSIYDNCVDMTVDNGTLIGNSVPGHADWQGANYQWSVNPAFTSQTVYSMNNPNTSAIVNLNFFVEGSGYFYFEYAMSEYEIDCLKIIADDVVTESVNGEPNPTLYHQGYTGPNDFGWNKRVLHFEKSGLHSINFNFIKSSGWLSEADKGYFNDVWIRCIEWAEGEALTADVTIDYDDTFGEISIDGTVVADGYVFTAERYRTYAVSTSFKTFPSVLDSTRNTSGYFCNYSFDDVTLSQNQSNVQFTSDCTFTATLKEKLLVPDSIDLITVVNGEQSEKLYRENGCNLQFSLLSTSFVKPFIKSFGRGESIVIEYDGNTYNYTQADAGYFYGESIPISSHGSLLIKTHKEGSYQDSDAYVINIELTLSETEIADLNSNIATEIIASDSQKITFVNDASTPFVFDLAHTSTNRIAYVSTNHADLSISNGCFKVTGNGVFAFDFFVSSESNYDNLMFSIGTPCNNASPLYYDGESAKATGEMGWTHYSTEISGKGANDITSVYIGFSKDSSTAAGLDLIGIGNVSFKSTYVTCAATAENGEYGSVTISDGVNIIVSGGNVQSASAVTFIANETENGKFICWKNAEGAVISYANPYTITISDNSSYVGVFAAKANSVVRINDVPYASLNDAISAAEGNQTIIIMQDIVLSSDLIIPANIKIVLPFKGDDVSGKEVGDGSNSIARVSFVTNPDAYLYRTLTVNNGVTLTINGSLVVGAVMHHPDQSAQGHTSGAYSKLVNNGAVIVNGVLENRGLIDGSGLLTVNGTLKTPFMVNNFSGGTNTEAHYSAGVFPFVQFSTVNIRCGQRVNYGAKVIGSTSLYFWSAVYEQDIVLINKIENKGGEGSLLWMEQGSYITISYDANKAVKQNVGNINLTDSGVSLITIYGSVTAGEFALQGYGSGDKVLAIPYTYNITVADDGVLTIANGTQYMVMPGAVLTVNNGGTLDVNGGLYVLDGLIQADKSGKSYPSSAILKSNGFAQSGMFVVNGKLRVYASGTFAGIAQSTSNSGVVEITSGAKVTKTLVLGSAGGYTDDTATVTLNAKVNGLHGNVFSILEAGKSYRAYNSAQFTLASFAMDSAARMSPISATINQEMTGSFGEKVSDGTVGVYTDVAIGEAVSGVFVKISGINYSTDENGEIIDAFVVFNAENGEFSYSTVGKQMNSYNGVYSSSIVLNKVIKSATLCEDNVYIRIYDSGENIVDDFVINAVLSYYGGGVSEKIALDENLSSSVYVGENVSLTSSSYPVCNFTHTLKQALASFAVYKSAVTALASKSSAKLVSACVTVYESYLALRSGRTASEIAFADEQLANYNDYFSVVKAITVSSATYGETDISATAVKIDGTSSSVTVAPIVATYQYAAGAISATYKYTGTYSLVDYSVNGVCSSVLARQIKVAVSDVTAVYGDTASDYEYSLSEGTIVDEFDDIVNITRVSGNTVGSYNITASSSSYYYAITFTYTANDHSVYSITARPITVTINNKTSAYGYAIADLDANVTVGSIVNQESVYSLRTTATSTSDVGEYAISGTNTNTNYNVAFVDGTYSITARPITVTISNKSSTYGDAIVGLDVIVTVGSIVNGDIVFSLNTEATSASEVGEYAILGTKTDDNYNVTFVDGTYSIIIRRISVKINNKTSVYGDAIVNLDATVTAGSVANGDTVYSLNTVATSVSDVGEYAITGTKTNNNYTVIFTNGVYTVTARPVTIKIEDKTSKYGDAIVALSANVTAGSVANGDSVYSLSTTATASSDIGEFAIEGTKTNTNYNVSFVNGKYTISARSIKVSVNNATSIYGNALENLSSTVIEGSVLANDTAYSLSTTATADSGVGTYSITGSLLDSNYAITFTYTKAANSQYTITARPISILINSKTITYGDSNVALTAELANNSLSFVGNDSLESKVSLSRQSGENAGSYLISGSCSDINYDISITTAMYTINARATLVTVADHSDVMLSKKDSIRFNAVRNYDNATLSDIGFEIRKNGELIATAAANGSVSVEAGKTFGTGVYDVYAAYSDSNYDITHVKGSLKIVEDNNYYAAEFSFSDNASKTYDGDNFEFTVIVRVSDTQEILTEGTDYSVTVLKNGATAVSEIKECGSYEVCVNILQEDISYSYNYSITQREITVQIADKSSVYGDDIAELTSEVTLGNIVEGDEVYSISTTATAISNVNEYAISGTKTNDNYKVNFQEGVYTISPREIKVEIEDKTSVYGDAISALTARVSEGSVVGSDSVYLLNTNVTSISAVGEYAITGTQTNSNYSVIFTNGKYNVTARPVTVTITDKTSVYGLSPVTLTAQVTAGTIIGSDNIYSLNTDATSVSDVGEYDITGTQTNSNYIVNFVNGVYIITIRNIKVDIADKTSVYGNEIAELTSVVIEGSIVNNDTVYSLITNASSTTDAGEYDITGTITNDNYSVNFVNGVYTVSVRALKVAVDNKTGSYGDAIVVLTAQVTEGSIVNDDIVYSLSTSVTSTTAVGKYAINCALEDTNYNIDITSGEYTVAPRAITVKIADKFVTYGDNLAELSSEVTEGSVVNNDVVYSLSTVATANSAVGEYPITGTKTNDNYSVEFAADATYSISAKEINVVVADKISVYGYAFAELTMTTEDTLAFQDTLDTLVALEKEAGNNAGTYAINATCNNKNYKLVYSAGVYSISPREISVVIASAQSTYGEEDAVIGYSLAENSSLGYNDLLNTIVAVFREQGTDAAAYAISGECINTNYNITFNTDAVYTIIPRPITVVADSKTSVYGDAFEPLTANITEGNLVTGDEIPYAVSFSQTKAAGEFAIEITATDDNYNVTVVNALYTVTARPISYKINNATSVYGDSLATLTAELTDGSLVYEDTADDLFSIQKAEGTTVGSYAISAVSAQNNNYALIFEYTSENASEYVITKRAVTLTVGNAESDNTDSWEAVNAKLSAQVTVGNVINNDDLGIAYSLVLDGVVLNSENYKREIRGGVHTITAACSNNNYDVTVIDGMLTVSKPKISVKDMKTEYIYADGAKVTMFDWQTNINGYLESATANSFRAKVYLGEQVEESKLLNSEGYAIDAGVYTVVIEIVHVNSYILADNATVSYTVNVAKKDIADALAPIGFTDGGKVAYIKDLEFTATATGYESAELKLSTQLMKGEEKADAITGSGEYGFVVTVEDANYCGTKSFTFTVVDNVSAKMSELSTKLVSLEDLEKSADKLGMLLEIRTLIAALSEDDNAQIAADEEYVAIMEEIAEEWSDYLEDVKEDAMAAEKACRNAVETVFEFLSTLAVACWFGTKYSV